MRKSHLVSLLLSLIALALAAGCAPVGAPPAEQAAEPAAGATAPVTVRIGTQPWIGYGPWWIAQEQGMFEAAGMQAEFIDFVTDAEVNAAFAAGEMDVANIATHTAMKLFTQGVAMQAVLLEDASYEADAIIAGPGIASVADLAGKSVAYEEGATSDLLLNAALADNGMTLADINPVPMPAADAGSALIAGQVDAAVTYEPYIAAAIAANPEIHVIYSGADKPGLISDVLAASTPFAQGNQETMRALLKVWDQAVIYLRDNPDEGRAIIAAAVGSTPEELASAFEGVVFYDLSENQQQYSGAFAQTANLIAATAQSIGILDEAPDFARLFVPDYLR